MFKKVFAAAVISSGIALHLKYVNKDKKCVALGDRAKEYCPVRYVKKYKEKKKCEKTK